MNTKILPHEYSFIRKEVLNLISAYSSVNGRDVIDALQAIATEHIDALVADKPASLTALMQTMLDVKANRVTIEPALQTLKDDVVPFEQPTGKQLEKVFRKVKKLKQPEWETMDLRDDSFLGWNDPGMGRKYVVIRNESGQLQGAYGVIEPTVQKGVCAICQTIGNVSLFMAITKSGGDGTYTKSGNYICRDSNRCNRQLSQLDSLHAFFETVRAK
ncbi:FusB/FusC family EF-G-binding protein [Furfurilactobacillus siliginis]|nr:FusB/FusC family EF-G-binding protein [Furfurilactobacillus siliginis]GEK29123.1 elongation factor G-binding protein [Furfurilactobacillus siliginis]